MTDTTNQGSFIPGLPNTSDTPAALKGFVDPSQQPDNFIAKLHGTSAGQEGQIALEQGAAKAAGIQDIPQRTATVKPSPSFRDSKPQTPSSSTAAPPSTGFTAPPDIFGGQTTGGTPSFAAPEGFNDYSFNLDAAGPELGLGGSVNIPGIYFNNETQQWFNGFTGKTFDADGTEVLAPGADPATDTTNTVNTTNQPGLNTVPNDSGAPSPGNALLPAVQVQGIATILGDPVMQKLVANMRVSDFMEMVNQGLPNPNEGNDTSGG